MKMQQQKQKQLAHPDHITIEHQRKTLKNTIDQLNDADIPITGVYMPSEDNDAGVEIDGKYILQIAPYHNPNYILDNLTREEVGTFEDVKLLIEYLKDNK